MCFSAGICMPCKPFAESYPFSGIVLTIARCLYSSLVNPNSEKKVSLKTYSNTCPIILILSLFKRIPPRIRPSFGSDSVCQFNNGDVFLMFTLRNESTKGTHLEIIRRTLILNAPEVLNFRV